MWKDVLSVSDLEFKIQVSTYFGAELTYVLQYLSSLFRNEIAEGFLSFLCIPSTFVITWKQNVEFQNIKPWPNGPTSGCMSMQGFDLRSTSFRLATHLRWLWSSSNSYASRRKFLTVDHPTQVDIVDRKLTYAVFTRDTFTWGKCISQ